MYLYVPADAGDMFSGEEAWQSDVPPSPEQIQSAIDDDLLIFRLGENNRFEKFEPIDSTDPDSWGDIPFQRK